MSGTTEEFKMPESRRPVRHSLDGGMIWIYGEPKIGKTTFASQFPGVWFWATEKGHDWVDCREPLQIESWPTFLKACTWFHKQEKKFGDGTPIRWLCFDTIDGLHKLCEAHVCNKLGVESLGDLHHGKGWSAFSQTWDQVMNKVRSWDVGLLCISHTKVREIKTRGTKVDRIEPAPGASCMRWCNAAADLIAYASSADRQTKDEDGNVTGVEQVRILQVHPSSGVLAGGRMSHVLPRAIPLSYAALIKHVPNSTPDEEALKAVDKADAEADMDEDNEGHHYDAAAEQDIP